MQRVLAKGAWTVTANPRTFIMTDIQTLTCKKSWTNWGRGLLQALSEKDKQADGMDLGYAKVRFCCKKDKNEHKIRRCVDLLGVC